MSNTSVKKLMILIISGITLVILFFGVYSITKIYNDIFRLSSTQVLDFLSDTKSQCKKIVDCKLLHGDILIRRYITNRTWIVDKFAHPYFTHSAFYLGDDKIVEAVGTEKNPEDEIQIATLSKSDWMNSDVNNFVIIRPKNYYSKLDVIKSNLKNIAEDKDYGFGLPKQGYKRATCADLIFQELFEEKVINISNVSKIITPDYLFWVTKNDPINFEIIGYSIQK